MKKKRLIAASLAAVIGVMTWMTPDSVRADEHEVEVPQLEEGTYVKGDCIYDDDAGGGSYQRRDGEL